MMRLLRDPFVHGSGIDLTPVFLTNKMTKFLIELLDSLLISTNRSIDQLKY